MKIFLSDCFIVYTCETLLNGIRMGISILAMNLLGWFILIYEFKCKFFLSDCFIVYTYFQLRH
jgi:hypothetical protein